MGLCVSELNLLWNIYVNIEYRTTYKHVWTCLSDLKFKKILFIVSDFYSHEAGKKNLVDAFYTQGGVLNFNQQLTMGSKSLWIFIKIFSKPSIFDREPMAPHTVQGVGGPRSSYTFVPFWKKVMHLQELIWSHQFASERKERKREKIKKIVLVGLGSRSWTIFNLIYKPNVEKISRHFLNCKETKMAMLL